MSLIFYDYDDILPDIGNVTELHLKAGERQGVNRDGKEKNLLRRYELDELGSSASLHFVAQLKLIRVG